MTDDFLSIKSQFNHHHNPTVIVTEWNKDLGDF